MSIIDPFAGLGGEDGADYSRIDAGIHVGVVKHVIRSGSSLRYSVRVPSINTSLDMPPCAAIASVGSSLPVNSVVLVAFVDGSFDQMFIIGKIS